MPRNAGSRSSSAGPKRRDDARLQDPRGRSKRSSPSRPTSIWSSSPTPTKTKQVWQWVARQTGQPAAYREYLLPATNPGDSLIEKLQAIRFPCDEEEALDLSGSVHKLRDAFDRDRITKRFYDHFQKEHKAFLEFIEGIPSRATGSGTPR